MNGRTDSAAGVPDPLAETVANLPLLLLLGGLAATLLPVACAVGIVTLVLSTLFGFPEITIHETTYEGEWLVFRFGPVLLVLGTMATAIAYSIWTRRAWGRGLVIAFWTSTIAFASLAAILHPVGGRLWFLVALYCAPMLPVSWLYLYRWERVVGYYHKLQVEEKSDESEKSAKMRELSNAHEGGSEPSLDSRDTVETAH